VLNLPAVERGREPIVETHLRVIAAATDWREQRRLWIQVLVRTGVAKHQQERRLAIPVDTLSRP